MSRSLHSPRYARMCVLLVRARRASGLTQRELGALLHLPQSFVSKYETRQVRLDVVQLAEILEHLGVDILVFVPQVLAPMVGRDAAIEPP